jgi:hypothetical protein
MDKGANQGCLFSSTLTALVLHSILPPLLNYSSNELLTDLPKVALGDNGCVDESDPLAYVDDNQICIYLPNALFFHARIRTACQASFHHRRISAPCHPWGPNRQTPMGPPSSNPSKSPMASVFVGKRLALPNFPHPSFPTPSPKSKSKWTNSLSPLPTSSPLCTYSPCSLCIKPPTCLNPKSPRPLPTESHPIQVGRPLGQQLLDIAIVYR